MPLKIQRPRRVANKIILLVLALELGSILLWGGLSYSGSREEILKTIGSQLSEVAYRATSTISNFFLPVDIETDVVTSALSSGFIQESKHIDISLHRVINSRPEIEEVSLTDEKGQELHRISSMRGIGSGDLRNLGDNPIIRKAKQGLQTTGSIVFSEYLDPKIEIATPIAANNRWDKHIIFSKINLKWLWDTVGTLQVNNTGYVYVVDESLKLIAHPDPSLVLSRQVVSGTDIPMDFFTGQGSDSLKIYSSLTGERVAGVSRFDPTHRWWVIVEQPVKEGLAPLNRIINRFILSFLLAASIAVIIVIIFARITMRPLEQVEEGISNLAEGKRNVQVNVSEDTELASLSLAFNRMAQNLDKQQAELEYQANHDSLTSLPNRKMLFSELKREILSNGNNENTFALLLLDLDRFKEINDSLGHKYGDILLKLLKPRLQRFALSDDIVARLGGDEFAFFMPSIENAEQAIDLAKQIRNAIKVPFTIEGMQVQIDGSIGIALFPSHGPDGTTLLRRADIAMYEAKQSGRGVAVYDRDLDANSPERLELIGGLRRAIEANELILHYQPKISLPDRKVIALEALVRWDHPQQGLICPDNFIPIGELGDAIISLTNWVIDRALTDICHWQENDLDLKVAINISALNIQDTDFVRSLRALTAKHNVSPHQIQLEITESVIMADSVRTLNTIRSLIEMGFSIAIDDFGTGYSSLAYLKKMQAEELKIDKSFVIDMVNDENDAVIVRSTIDLAHNLGLRVTAEGVEHLDALDLLEALDCDYAQGFAICVPVAAEQIIPWKLQWEQSLKPRPNNVLPHPRKIK